MSYKIIDKIWFTDQSGNCIGIVAISSGPDGGWKAYIGVSISTDDEDLAAQHIARNGGKIPASIACAAFAQQDREMFRT